MACIIDRTNVFWEDSDGRMFFFDKSEVPRNNRNQITKTCNGQSMVKFTGKNEEMEEKAKEFGISFSFEHWRHTICIDKYSDSLKQEKIIG